MRKSGKKPTLSEKKLIVAAHLSLDNWLVQKKDTDYLYVVHRVSGNVRKIPYALAGRR